MWEIYVQGLVDIPSLLQQLLHSHNFFSHLPLSMTVKPMAFSTSSVSSAIKVKVNGQTTLQLNVTSTCLHCHSCCSLQALHEINKINKQTFHLAFPV